MGKGHGCLHDGRLQVERSPEGARRCPHRGWPPPRRTRAERRARHDSPTPPAARSPRAGKAMKLPRVRRTCQGRRRRSRRAVTHHHGGLSVTAVPPYAPCRRSETATVLKVGRRASVARPCCASWSCRSVARASRPRGSRPATASRLTTEPSRMAIPYTLVIRSAVYPPPVNADDLPCAASPKNIPVRDSPRPRSNRAPGVRRPGPDSRPSCQLPTSPR